MKREILLSLCVLAAAGAAHSQTTAFYVNDGVVNCPPDIPPQVEAVNFVNNNFFQISFTNLTINSPLYYTSRTLNFTNRGVMNGYPGFEFVTAPRDAGQKTMAGSIYNSGTINVGNASNIVFLVGPGVAAGLPKLLGTATNIINPGLITLGYEALCRFQGETVDLTRGSIMMTNNGYNYFNNFLTFFNNGGFVDGYWGLGTHVYNPAAYFEANPAFTPSHLVTNRDYLVYMQQLAPPTALAYLSDVTAGSNRLVRAVFMNNTNLAFPADVYFPLFGDIAIEWRNVTTNVFKQAVTNYVQLWDYFEFLNPVLYWNGWAGAGLTKMTYQPSNYNFFRSPYSLSTYAFAYGNPVSPGGIPAGTFDSRNSTNSYTAYEARFLPTTLVPSDVASQDATNLPGRIEISASKSLDLNRARISGLNYLSLQSTNSFLGSSHAQIGAPYCDINLRRTNGEFAITNLLVKSLPLPEGTIDLYSSCWTNVVNDITNTFHVLYVDARISPESPPRVQSLTLRSLNSEAQDDYLQIHDAMNVTRSMLLDSRRITIATNAPGAEPACGSLSLLSSTITWPNAAPRVQFLTNNGVFQTLNAVFFGGTRCSPFYTTNFTEPYVSFVNRGGVTNAGSLIWSTHFENSGTFRCIPGDIQLQQCAGAILTNGNFIASNGVVLVSAGGLLVSNHTMVAGTGISLNVTNILSDGVPNLALVDPALQTSTFITNGNNWWCSGGLFLPTKPTFGDLHGTTVHVMAPDNAEVPIMWAGEDRGMDVYSPTSSGFMNNAALGKLVLEGHDGESLFHFVSPYGNGGRSALYVDCIELRNVTSTNFDVDGNLEGVQLDPNVRVYFAQALANGISIAEKLNGHEGFIWVSNYNYGYFSSTNIVYPNGTTNRLNAALAGSCDLDSNGNGIVNCMDPAPLPLTSWRPVGTDVVGDLSEIAPPVQDPGPGLLAMAPYRKVSKPTDPGVSPTTGLPTLGQPPSADFLPTGFLAAGQGSYSGLFADENGVSVGSAGYFNANVTAGGAYSGKLVLAGRSYSFSGQFSTAGTGTNLVRRGTSTALRLELQIDLNGGDQIRGTLSEPGKWSASLHADRLVFSKSKNPAISSKSSLSYTLILPPADGGPAGYGYGTVKLDAAGTVQWSVTLADGSKVSQSTSLAKDGFWPLYSSLNTGKGLLVGWLQFTNQPDSDLSGSAVWIKPATASFTSYPGGFTNALPAFGSRYVAPASGHRYLDMTNASLVFSYGNVAFTNAFALDARNRVLRPNGSRLSLTFTSTSGLFQGSTLNPVSGRTFSFQGVLFEQGTNGFGLFFGPKQVGQVYLSPTP